MQIERGVQLGAGATVWCAPGGRIIVRRGATLLGKSSLVAGAGATVEIGERVFIGGHSVIAAEDHVSIGAESMIAELVAIRDHDHDPAYPPLSGRKLSAPIRVGERVWIGAKASIGRGVEIGDDAVIAAHAFVSKSVRARALAGGVPARVIRTEIKAG